MALYRYNARDRENRKYKGVKEAGSEAELVKALLEDGLYCCSLKNEERTASMKHFTVPLKLLPPLCSQVSSMMEAGVPQADSAVSPLPPCGSGTWRVQRPPRRFPSDPQNGRPRCCRVCLGR
mgnify:CR=1 FL=1